ncbi:polysaccharide-forming b-glycosyltransferase-related protein, glycosyltransferase family 2 protein [hydrothermal vent metagenome]|uniref:Polysaccharide-forming b-glycosyltransferase-related protein, glycosyltransferase family 2 protein n=1 Tax=hydrothermal vent metagenome TaxID=652676 RepID=A0A3B0UX23_9ZZZZ
MIELIAILIIGIAVSKELLLIILWLTNFKIHNIEPKNYPMADILIAARNEEANIATCLDSLLALDYPKEKLTIWVGDDASKDNTWGIIEKYSAVHSNIKGVQITTNITKGNGKANVLAQLAQKSNSNWIFITDADIRVPRQWLQAMLAAAKTEQAALVTGTSLVIGDAWLAKFQRLDWLYATAMLKIVSDLGIPVTTMGNNMAISRKVYNEVGGFESLPFSVTEDLELFKAVKNKHKTINLWSPKVLNKSAPQPTLLELLKQRKRWMRGAFELPFQLLGLLILEAVYLPTIIILIAINPIMGILFWVLKWLLKYTFEVICAKKIDEKVSLFDSFVSEWYSVLFSLASVLYYLWPGKVYWKGRKY